MLGCYCCQNEIEKAKCSLAKPPLKLWLVQIITSHITLKIWLLTPTLNWVTLWQFNGLLIAENAMYSIMLTQHYMNYEYCHEIVSYIYVFFHRRAWLLFRFTNKGALICLMFNDYICFAQLIWLISFFWNLYYFTHNNAHKQRQCHHSVVIQLS